MGKLHEILAAEASVKEKGKLILEEAKSTFKNKQGHFEGLVKNFEKAGEDDYDLPSESKHVQTTVLDKLNYVKKAYSSRIDLIMTKDQTNASTKADLIVNGETLLKDMSGPALLSLATEVDMIRKLVADAPTLSPDKVWTFNTDQNLYETAEVSTVKTKKIEEPIVLYPATPEHPAQTQLRPRDVPHGFWKTKHLSGAISPKDKADMLDKLDLLYQEIKRAIKRANDVPAINMTVGEKIFSYFLPSA